MSKPTVELALRVAVGSALAAALMATGACSSDDDAKPSGPTTTAPEQKISSDVEVAAGLSRMKLSAADVVAAGSDAAAAGKADDELEPVWKDIEGTVKQNEPDIYVEIEDSMSLLSDAADGDQAKGKIGATDMAKAIDSYLAKHPGSIGG